MFLQPQLSIFLLLIFVAIYWSISPDRPNIRTYWLIFSSIMIIGIAAPYAMLAAIAISLMVWVWLHVFSQIKRMLGDKEILTCKKYTLSVGALNSIIFWLAICSVILPLLVIDIYERKTTAATLIITLGISYVVIKSIGVLIDAYYSRTVYSIKKILLLNLFFPIYSSGPIEYLSSFEDKVIKRSFSSTFIFQGIGRLALGLLKTYLIADILILNNLNAYFFNIDSNPDSYSGIEVILYILTRFLYVYINFSGYTDLAIGSALLFGIKVSENFNFPIIATNIQNFWTRWHISLSNFIKNYIYLRLVVILRRPYIPLFIAFVLVGLWHKIAPGYLLWGIGHGGGLVIYMLLKKKYASGIIYDKLSRFPVYIFLSWFVTMFYVSLLSFIANSKSLDSAANVLVQIFK